MNKLNSITKHRTQVYFPKDLFREIKKASRKRNVSIAEVIRGAVRKELGWVREGGKMKRAKAAAWKKFFADAGMGMGPKDLSYNHDRYFE